MIIVQNDHFSACLLLSPNPNYEKIISYCKQVLEFSPTNCKAHFRLAQAQFKVGDYDGAMQSINNTEKFQDQPGIPCSFFIITEYIYIYFPHN